MTGVQTCALPIYKPGGVRQHIPNRGRVQTGRCYNQPIATVWVGEEPFEIAANRIRARTKNERLSIRGRLACIDIEEGNVKSDHSLFRLGSRIRSLDLNLKGFQFVGLLRHVHLEFRFPAVGVAPFQAIRSFRRIGSGAGRRWILPDDRDQVISRRSAVVQFVSAELKRSIGINSPVWKKLAARILGVKEYLRVVCRLPVHQNVARHRIDGYSAIVFFSAGCTHQHNGDRQEQYESANRKLFHTSRSKDGIAGVTHRGEHRKKNFTTCPPLLLRFS